MTAPVYFDRIHQHFLKNIYTRPKGKIRLAVLQRDLSPLIQNMASKCILDVGGGSGQMALWALAWGHQVTLVDNSLEQLDTAWALAEQANLTSRLTLIQADATTLSTLDLADDFDMLFCHALLEWVERGESLLNECTQLLKQDGVLSLLHYNRQALVFAQHVFGNFDYMDDYLAANLVNKNAAKLTPKCLRDHHEIQGWFQALGYQCTLASGVRCFYDYMKPRDKERNTLEDIIEHELTMSLQAQYLPVARYRHELWQKIGKDN